MINTFKNIDNFNTFKKDGYVKIPAVIDIDDIIELKAYFNDKLNHNIQNSIYGMYVSLDDTNKQASLDAMYKIQNIVTPKLNNHLKNYKTHLGSYLVKMPDPYSFTYPHQDWLFIDNNNKDDFSCTIWISLEDIDKNEGTLGFIKGSHHFLNNIIGSPSPEIKTATMGHEELLLSYLQIEKVKAGDALLFNNKTIHAAFPNNSTLNRIAVGIGITPIESTLYHYFLKPTTTNKIYKLRVAPEFYNTYNNDSLRKLYRQNKTPDFSEIAEEIKYQPTLFSKEELEHIILENGNVKNRYDTSMLFAQFKNMRFIDKIKMALDYYFNIKF
jgi:hypothetical protein